MRTRVETPDSCPDFKSRATSGFRPKLHSRAESLSLENLDMSCAVVRKSLDIPKFGRESLDMGREILCSDFCDPFPDFATKFWYVQTFAAHGANHVQTFQTRTLGATVKMFEANSGIEWNLFI